MMTLAIVLFLLAVICNTVAVYHGAQSRYRPAAMFLAASGVLKTAVIALLWVQLR